MVSSVGPLVVGLSKQLSDSTRGFSVMPKTSLEEHFLAGIPPNLGPDECWHWLGIMHMAYYGQFKHDHKRYAAHRFSYEYFVGPIPEGLVIDHLCRIPSCVNPKHLEPVTVRENTRRGISPPAQIAKLNECLHGHPLTAENIWISVDGCRICKTCSRARGALRRARHGDEMRIKKRLRMREIAAKNGTARPYQWRKEPDPLTVAAVEAADGGVK